MQEPGKPTRAKTFVTVSVCALTIGLAVYAVIQSQRSRHPVARKAPPAIPPAAVSSLVTATVRDTTGVFQLMEGGEVQGPNLPPEDAAAVRSLIVSRRAEVPPLIRRMSGKGRETPRLLEPVATAVVSPTPYFRWDSSGIGVEYQAAIYDSRRTQAAVSPWMTQTSWVLAKPLQRGEIYWWQVTARRSGAAETRSTPLPEVRFFVLAEPALVSLEAALGGAGESHLVRGIIYSQYGLIDDAEREFRSLGRLNPDQSWIRRVLESLRPQPVTSIPAFPRRFPSPVR